MIDTTSPSGRAVVAALRLAEKRAWRQITLLEVADEAGLTLAELSRSISSKSGLLRAFVRHVDEAVLRKAERREPEESPRERLFDVVMTRFETMAPYKGALRRITAQAPFAPELAPAVLASQSWMLIAAGIPADGLTGAARVAGLGSVYAATFRDWLEEDDAGMAKTMAGLDRRLRRGESWIESLDSFAATGQGALDRLREGLLRRASARGHDRASSSTSSAAGESAPATAESAASPSAHLDPEPPKGSSSLH